MDRAGVSVRFRLRVKVRVRIRFKSEICKLCIDNFKTAQTAHSNVIISVDKMVQRQEITCLPPIVFASHISLRFQKKGIEHFSHSSLSRHFTGYNSSTSANLASFSHSLTNRHADSMYVCVYVFKYMRKVITHSPYSLSSDKAHD